MGPWIVLIAGAVVFFLVGKKQPTVTTQETPPTPPINPAVESGGSSSLIGIASAGLPYFKKLLGGDGEVTQTDIDNELDAETKQALETKSEGLTVGKVTTAIGVGVAAGLVGGELDQFFGGSTPERKAALSGMFGAGAALTYLVVGTVVSVLAFPIIFLTIAAAEILLLVTAQREREEQVKHGQTGLYYDLLELRNSIQGSCKQQLGLAFPKASDDVVTYYAGWMTDGYLKHYNRLRWFQWFTDQRYVLLVNDQSFLKAGLALVPNLTGGVLADSRYSGGEEGYLRGRFWGRPVYATATHQDCFQPKKQKFTSVKLADGRVIQIPVLQGGKMGGLPVYENSGPPICTTVVDSIDYSRSSYHEYDEPSDLAYNQGIGVGSLYYNYKLHSQWTDAERNAEHMGRVMANLHCYRAAMVPFEKGQAGIGQSETSHAVYMRNRWMFEGGLNSPDATLDYEGHLYKWRLMK